MFNEIVDKYFKGYPTTLKVKCENGKIVFSAGLKSRSTFKKWVKSFQIVENRIKSTLIFNSKNKSIARRGLNV